MFINIWLIWQSFTTAVPAVTPTLTITVDLTYHNSDPLPWCQYTLRTLDNSDPRHFGTIILVLKCRNSSALVTNWLANVWQMEGGSYKISQWYMEKRTIYRTCTSTSRHLDKGSVMPSEKEWIDEVL